MPTFAEMAERANMPAKGLYTTAEVSQITGVPYETLRQEINAGRLGYVLPMTRRRGRMHAPEYVDQWLEGAKHEQSR